MDYITSVMSIVSICAPNSRGGSTLQKWLLSLLSSIVSIILAPIRESRICPLCFTSFLFCRNLREGATVTIIYSGNGVFNTQVRFPSRFCVNFSVVIMSRSDRISSLIFRIFCVCAFKDPFHCICVAIEWWSNVSTSRTTGCQGVSSCTIVLEGMKNPSFLSRCGSRIETIFSLVFIRRFARSFLPRKDFKRTFTIRILSCSEQISPLFLVLFRRFKGVLHHVTYIKVMETSSRSEIVFVDVSPTYRR